MSEYYGFPSGEASDLRPYLKSFNVTYPLEGPQVLLKWEFVDDALIAEFKIVKKELMFPLHINDGILVVHNKISGAFGDLDVKNGVIYYYTMFIRPVAGLNYLFSGLSMGKVLALKTGYYEDKLWELLPEIYRINDVDAKTLLKGWI